MHGAGGRHGCAHGSAWRHADRTRRAQCVRHREELGRLAAADEAVRRGCVASVQRVGAEVEGLRAELRAVEGARQAGAKDAREREAALARRIENKAAETDASLDAIEDKVRSLY